MGMKTITSLGVDATCGTTRMVKDGFVNVRIEKLKGVEIVTPGQGLQELFGGRFRSIFRWPLHGLPGKFSQDLKIVAGEFPVQCPDREIVLPLIVVFAAIA